MVWPPPSIPGGATPSPFVTGTPQTGASPSGATPIIQDPPKDSGKTAFSGLASGFTGTPGADKKSGFAPSQEGIFAKAFKGLEKMAKNPDKASSEFRQQFKAFADQIQAFRPPPNSQLATIFDQLKGLISQIEERLEELGKNDQTQAPAGDDNTTQEAGGDTPEVDGPADNPPEVEGPDNEGDVQEPDAPDEPDEADEPDAPENEDQTQEAGDTTVAEQQGVAEKGEVDYSANDSRAEEVDDAVETVESKAKDAYTNILEMLKDKRISKAIAAFSAQKQDETTGMTDENRKITDQARQIRQELMQYTLKLKSFF